MLTVAQKESQSWGKKDGLVLFVYGPDIRAGFMWLTNTSKTSSSVKSISFCFPSDSLARATFLYHLLAPPDLPHLSLVLI